MCSPPFLSLAFGHHGYSQLTINRKENKKGNEVGGWEVRVHAMHGNKRKRDSGQETGAGLGRISVFRSAPHIPPS